MCNLVLQNGLCIDYNYWSLFMLSGGRDVRSTEDTHYDGLLYVNAIIYQQAAMIARLHRLSAF